MRKSVITFSCLISALYVLGTPATALSQQRQPNLNSSGPKARTLQPLLSEDIKNLPNAIQQAQQRWRNYPRVVVTIDGETKTFESSAALRRFLAQTLPGFRSSRSNLPTSTIAFQESEVQNSGQSSATQSPIVFEDSDSTLENLSNAQPTEVDSSAPEEMPLGAPGFSKSFVESEEGSMW